jgi:exopolysaccharide biosynthesis polyprenyl glycosylphosphotransferase
MYTLAGLPSARRDAIGLAKSSIMSALLLTAFIYLSHNQLVSRLVVNATVSISFLTMFGWRCWRRRRLRTAAPDGVTCHNALIVGYNPAAERVRAHLNEHRELGLSVRGFLSHPTDILSGRIGCLGTFEDLERVVRAHFIDELIICTSDRESVKTLVYRARHCGVSVRVVPDLYDGLAWGAPVDYLGEVASICLHRKRIPAGELFVKRVIDTLITGIGVVALAPLFACIAIAIRIDSPGPILYVSRRVGRKGNIFSCYKFRTMVVDAERLKAALQHLNERDGVLFKISNDPRITRVGRYLRKYSLDELAQFWNVLRGEMSLVGPRPPLANEVEKYQLDHLRRLEVAPGITGLWQVEARTDPSFDQYIELDLQYVRNWSLFLDLKIILKTVAVLVAGTGQ